MPDSKTETGPTWTGYFPTARSASCRAGDPDRPRRATTSSSRTSASTPIAGVKGGQSTFVGGDGIGIGARQQGPRPGLELLAWLEGEEAQVDVIAKGGNVVSRTDLANNQYSAADPRLVMFNTIAGKGQTPFALNFGQTFNDPQGPWLVLLRDAVFGDASKIDADNDAINASLQP